MIKSKYIISAFLLLLMVAILINPATYITAAKDGMLVFALNVIPSLFPFLFISKMLSELSQEGYTPKFAGKVYSKTLNLPSSTLGTYFLGIISGYPVGSKLISEQSLDTGTAKKMCFLFSNPSIIFAIGTIGASMLGSVMAGIIIYISNLLAGIISGVVFGRRIKSENKNSKYTKSIQSEDILYNTITNSVLSILVVGGYIILFSVLSCILLELNIFYPICILFQKIGVPIPVTESFLIGLVEFTNGCIRLSRLGLNIQTVTIFCSMLTAFGGLSIAAQSATYLRRCNITLRFYFFTKLIHLIIVMLLAFILCSIFL